MTNEDRNLLRAQLLIEAADLLNETEDNPDVKYYLVRGKKYYSKKDAERAENSKFNPLGDKGKVRYSGPTRRAVKDYMDKHSVSLKDLDEWDR